MTGKIKKIIKSAKNVIFADPQLIFEEERHLISQPFYFEGTNGQAVLLIHGWTATPYEVRRLGKYLNENGYSVSAPMLRGHGTKCEDLEKVDWKDWLEDVSGEYERLKKTHAKVFVGGTSIGACLAAIMAQRNPEMAGMVLMAMPYKVKLEKAVVFCLNFLKLFKKYNRKFYPPTFGVSTTVTRLIAYKSYPIKSVLDAAEIIREARENLSLIKQPCFILQSSSDHIVAKNSLEKIFSQINSKKKRKKYIKRAYHTFISDIRNEDVFEEILDFIRSN